MGSTFIYDDSARAPKEIDVDVSCSKVKANEKVSNLKVKKIVMVYAHGGVNPGKTLSAFMLTLSGRRKTLYQSIDLKNLFSNWFSLTTKNNKVEEIHLLCCHSADTPSSVAYRVANCGIKEVFPNITRVVGIKGVIDQSNTADGIRLLSQPTGTILGYSKSITKDGLPLDNPCVKSFAVL